MVLKDVLFFVKYGKLGGENQHDAVVPAIIPALDSLVKTSAYQEAYSTYTSSNVYVTFDYANTVKLSDGSVEDDFTKSVNWVLTTDSHEEVLLILSQYEANQLLPEIRKSPHCRLNIYAPRFKSPRAHLPTSTSSVWGPV